MASEGKRERKQAQVVNIGAPEEKEGLVVPDGSGTPLGDIEHISVSIKAVKGDSEMLRALHLFLFGSPGKGATRKKNLRMFKGFPKGDKSVDARVQKMVEKPKVWNVPTLKELADMLGVEKGGDREALIRRVVEFLDHPSGAKSKSSGGKKRKTEEGEGGKAKKSKKTGEEKPKRGASAFMIFSSENRNKIKGENPDLAFGDLSKKVGELWRKMSDKEKAKYEKKAAAAKPAEAPAEKAEPKKRKAPAEKGGAEKKTKKEAAAKKPAANGKGTAAKDDDKAEDEEIEVTEDEVEEAKAEENGEKEEEEEAPAEEGKDDEEGAEGEDGKEEEGGEAAAEEEEEANGDDE